MVVREYLDAGTYVENQRLADDDNPQRRPFSTRDQKPNAWGVEA